MSLYKQLSTLDVRKKHAVYGYIREQEKELKLMNVPNMITAICILFFATPQSQEFFKFINKRKSKLSLNKRIITQLSYGIRQKWSHNQRTPETGNCDQGRR